MSTIKQVEDAFADWCTAAGLECMWLNDTTQGPQLPYPYVSMQIIHSSPNSVVERGQTYDEGDDQVSLHYRTMHRMCLRVQVHSDRKPGTRGAFDLAEALAASLDTVARREAFEAVDVALMSKERMMESPYLNNTSWVDRVVFDLQFIRTTILSEEIEHVEEVAVTGTVEDDVAVTESLIP